MSPAEASETLAVLLLGGSPFEPGGPQAEAALEATTEVGGLSLALRAVLTAQAAGATRVYAVAPPELRARLEPVLAAHARRRVPIEWLAEGEPLPDSAPDGTLLLWHVRTFSAPEFLRAFRAHGADGDAAPVPETVELAVRVAETARRLRLRRRPGAPSLPLCLAPDRRRVLALNRSDGDPDAARALDVVRAPTAALRGRPLAAAELRALLEAEAAAGRLGAFDPAASELAGTEHANPDAAPPQSPRPPSRRWPARTLFAATLRGAADVRPVLLGYLRSLENPADGLVDTYFNRKLARRLTLALLPTRMTPNQVTLLALLLGLAGAGLLGLGQWLWAVVGAGLFQLSAVLDCTDGEIARTKFQTSRVGRWLDPLADNVVHLAVFAGILLHALARDQTLAGGQAGRLGQHLLLGLAAMVGVVLSFVAVYWVQAVRARVVEQRGAPAERSWLFRLARLADRMTNRDFSVLVLGLAAADRLAWFLWPAALGANLFWLALLGLGLATLLDRRTPASRVLPARPPAPPRPRTPEERRRRLVLRLVQLGLLLLGLAVVAYMIYISDPRQIANRFLGLLNWRNVPLLLLPYLLGYTLDATGWYFAFGPRKPRVGPLTLFAVRMAGEAVNFTTPLAYTGGEPLKALMLSRRGVPFAETLASAIIAKTTMTLAQVVFVALGLTATWFALAGKIWGESQRLFLVAMLIGVAVLVGLCAFFLLLQRLGLFAGLRRFVGLLHWPAGGLDRVGLRRLAGLLRRPTGWLDRRRGKLDELDRTLSDFYRHQPRDCFLSCLFFFLGWCAGTLEVYLMLKLLRWDGVTLLNAFAIESLAMCIKSASFFMPASLGVQDVGNVGLLAFFGAAKNLGVSFALLRRMREIFWIVFGLALLGADQLDGSLAEAELERQAAAATGAEGGDAVAPPAGTGSPAGRPAPG